MIGHRLAAQYLVALALVGLLHCIEPAVAYGQQGDDPAALNAEVVRLYKAGQYAQGVKLARRVLAIEEKAHGPDHPNVGSAVHNLAAMYLGLGRHSEAVPLFKRYLAISEKTVGRDHADFARALNGLAAIYASEGRPSEAIPLFRRSIQILEKALGPEHLEVGVALNFLADQYNLQRHLLDAEPLYRRAIRILEKNGRPARAYHATALRGLADLLSAQGRYGDAETLFKRSLAIQETALGSEHLAVGETLNSLAQLYRAQGRFPDAEALHKRGLAVREKALGREHIEVARSLSNLATVYADQGRYGEAEPLHLRSISIFKTLPGSVSEMAGVLTNLATMYQSQGRLADAEPAYQRSLAVYEKAYGSEHVFVASLLNNLGNLYRAQSRHAEAAPLLMRALGIFEKTLGPNHLEVSASLNNLAWLAFAHRDWTTAASYWRRSTGVIRQRVGLSTAILAESSSKSEAQRFGWQFDGLIRATHRLAGDGHEATAGAEETFEFAQWAQISQAAASLTLMAARSSKGLPDLADLARERQDLAFERQANDKLQIAAKSEPPAKRNSTFEKALNDRLTVISNRLATIDARFAKDFPDYAELARPGPVSVAGVQSQLATDEALVLFFDSHEHFAPLPEETFIWVVTRSHVRWVRSDLGTAALTREVAALRCGLDATAWDGDGGEKCAKALGGPRTRPLRFDHARAHALHIALFGKVQELINGKHLLIVPSGPLTQLPFQVLVTKTPASGDHRTTAWLAREHAITILPAVSSLKALRRIGKSSAAPRAMVGIGNPLLDGPDVRYASLAKQAQAKQRCPDQRPQQVARSDARTGPARVETRAGLANVTEIRGQVPLPETADELCAVAQDVKADTGRDVLLGAKATEREVKRLSAAGELAKYRMVHFATHGVLAGDLKGTNEPGLILTPPATASGEDDGYLSASEIAALKLDADWVILSACNTAAGAATSAEALSGLARAFIYAQARALLVSHWEVYSDATVKLITGTVREMARDPKVGRAEALRRSMLALIDKGAPQEAHPAYWAPFVLVGEGGAER